jgi:hypothetical protein
MNEECSSDMNAEYFDGIDGRTPTARGNVSQLLELVVERYAARSRMEDIVEGEVDGSESEETAESAELSKSANSI